MRHHWRPQDVYLPMSNRIASTQIAVMPKALTTHHIDWANSWLQSMDGVNVAESIGRLSCAWALASGVGSREGVAQVPTECFDARAAQVGRREADVTVRARHEHGAACEGSGGIANHRQEG